MTNNMELIMLIGIPGSGKSTVAERYAEEGYRVHSSDAIRALLYGNEVIQGKASEVFQNLMQNVLKDLRNGHSCVIDATNLSRKRRIAMMNSLSKLAERKTCVMLLTPPDDCQERNSRRHRNVPPDQIRDMLCSFETPYYYEGWDSIDAITGGTPYLFPREAAADFQQDNPYHSMTLGAHMEAAREYCAFKGFSEEVQEAAWYHDIGKLYTRRHTNRKGETTEYAHYYGHENYGAYLYLCEKAAASVQNRTWERTLYIANLINWHMRPLRQHQRTLEKVRNIVGDHMYGELMQLHLADVTAH